MAQVEGLRMHEQVLKLTDELETTRVSMCKVSSANCVLSTQLGVALVDVQTLKDEVAKVNRMLIVADNEIQRLQN